MSSDEPNNAEEGPVLGPEELDISQEDNVLEIDEGRYVISPHDNSSPTPPQQATDTGDKRAYQEDESRFKGDVNEPEDRHSPSNLTRDEVHRWLHGDFSMAQTQYGFDVTAKFDDTISQQRLVSNNVVTAFENLILWYAQQIGGQTPVEEVLGILLTEANIPIRYPHRTLVSLLQYHNLTKDNSIHELLSAVKEHEGVLLPPTKDRRLKNNK